MSLVISPTGAIDAGVFATFEHATLEDVVDAMGNGEAGEASFDFGLNYAHANGSVTSVDLTVTLTILLPVWEPEEEPSRPESNEWNRFLRALRAHEDGHIDIFRREAAVTYRRLLASKPSKIVDKLESERRRIKRLSDAYDTRTGHGTTQQTAHGTTVITIP